MAPASAVAPAAQRTPGTCAPSHNRPSAYHTTVNSNGPCLAVSPHHAGCADYSRCAGLPEYRLPGISELHTASGAPGIADGFIGLRPDAA